MGDLMQTASLRETGQSVVSKQKNEAKEVEWSREGAYKGPDGRSEYKLSRRFRLRNVIHYILVCRFVSGIPSRLHGDM